MLSNIYTVLREKGSLDLPSFRITCNRRRCRKESKHSLPHEELERNRHSLELDRATVRANASCCRYYSQVQCETEMEKQHIAAAVATITKSRDKGTTEQQLLVGKAFNASCTSATCQLHTEEQHHQVSCQHLPYQISAAHQSKNEKEHHCTQAAEHLVCRLLTVVRYKPSLWNVSELVL